MAKQSICHVLRMQLPIIMIMYKRKRQWYIQLHKSKQGMKRKQQTTTTHARSHIHQFLKVKNAITQWTMTHDALVPLLA